MNRPGSPRINQRQRAGVRRVLLNLSAGAALAGFLTHCAPAQAVPAPDTGPTITTPHSGR